MLLLAAAAAAAAVAFVVVLNSGTGADSVVLRGELTLTDSSSVTGDADFCFGDPDSGYDDFGPGMDVTISNDRGEIIGSTNTVPLKSAEAGEAGFDLSGYDLTSGCTVVWATKVPSDARFYVVKVGRRGELSFSNAEMVENDWKVASSLG